MIERGVLRNEKTSGCQVASAGLELLGIAEHHAGRDREPPDAEPHDDDQEQGHEPHGQAGLLPSSILAGPVGSVPAGGRRDRPGDWTSPVRPGTGRVQRFRRRQSLGWPADGRSASLRPSIRGTGGGRRWPPAGLSGSRARPRARAGGRGALADSSFRRGPPASISRRDWASVGEGTGTSILISFSRYCWANSIRRRRASSSAGRSFSSGRGSVVSSSLATSLNPKPTHRTTRSRAIPSTTKQSPEETRKLTDSRTSRTISGRQRSRLSIRINMVRGLSAAVMSRNSAANDGGNRSDFRGRALWRGQSPWQGDWRG